MKPFLFVAIAALVAGGIYHTEVSEYVADLTDGSSSSGSVTSVADSMRDMGSSGNNLMRGIGNTLNR